MGVARKLGIVLTALVLLSVLMVPKVNLFGVVNADGNNEISSCGVVINEPGYYFVTTDLQGGSGICIFVNTSNVTIDGRGHWLNTTSRFGDNYGISTGKGHQRTNLTIKNVKFGKWWRALYLEGAINSSVFNNTFSGNFYSLELPFTENLEVYNNTFKDNLFAVDLYYGAKNNRIHDNDIHINDHGAFGISLSGDLNYPVVNNSISNNTIIAPFDPTGRSFWIAIDIEHDVLYNKVIGNYILNAPIELPNGAHWNTTVENNTIEYSDLVFPSYGIHLRYTRNDTIRHNVIKNAFWGIITTASDRTCICNNTLYNTFGGIGAASLSFTDFGNNDYYNLTNCIISGNAIYLTDITGSVPTMTPVGIVLYRDNPNALVINITVSNNEINALSPGSNAGIGLYGATNVLIRNNSVENVGAGLLLSATNRFMVGFNNLQSVVNGTFINGSTNGVLTGNVIRASNFSMVLNSSSNIAIYNNILNSTNGVKFLGSYNFITFNTTKTRAFNIVGGPYIGGNFWAKPDGTGFSETCREDENKDGICDTPYEVYSQEVDELPLTYPPLLPDLTVLSINPIIVDKFNDEYIVNVTIKNLGEDNATNFNVTLNSSGGPIGITTVPLLEPGERLNVTFNWNPTPGDYNLTAIVDPGYPNDNVVESNESNNNLTIGVRVIQWRADLNVTSINLPVMPQNGSPVQINVTVKNSGNLDSGPFNLTVYSNGSEVNTTMIPKLAPGEEMMKTLTWTPAKPGLYNITAIADPENVVEESNESNNEVIAWLLVVKAPIYKPDIHVFNLTVSGNLKQGGTVIINASVENLGNITATNVPISLHINGKSVNNATIPLLNVNEVVTISFQVTLTDGGPTKVKIIADPENIIPEFNESNNEVSETVFVEPKKKEAPPWEAGRKTFGVLFDLWNLWTAWFFLNYDELPELYEKALEAGVPNETLEQVKSLNMTAVKTIKEAWRDYNLESIRAKKWKYLKSTVLWYKAREAFMLEKEAVETLKKTLGIK